MCDGNRQTGCHLTKGITDATAVIIQTASRSLNSEGFIRELS